MIVNYNNCLFIISSVLSVVCAAPVEESPNRQDEASKVGQYQPQYPFVLDRPFNPAYPAYGAAFVPPSANVQSRPVYLVDLVVPRENNNPENTNEINNEEDDGVVSILLHTPEDDRSYDTRGDRKKRDVGTELDNDLKAEDVPEDSKVGKLRKKRTFCRKCGGGGYYRPQVYPVYGGGGGGCNYCGGGRPQYGGYGGGGGGSFSQSSSQSSSSSWGYGKK